MTLHFPALTLFLTCAAFGGKSSALIQVYQSSILPKADHLAANEAALLKSKIIIAAAAKDSEFEPRMISSAFEVKVIAGTDLLTLSAHHAEKGHPKKIVQAVLDSYRKHRKKIESEYAREMLKILDQELIEQSDVVQDTRKELTSLIGNNGIPHFDGGETTPQGAIVEEMFRTARTQLNQFKTQYNQIEIHIKKLTELKKSELIRYAAGLDLPENQVTDYYTKHREALADRTMLLAQGLGKDHPKILAAQKRAKSALKNAGKEASSLKLVLETKNELITKQIEKMKEMIAARKTGQADLNLRQKAYNTAKANYEEAREQLRNLKINQQESRVSLKPNKPAFIVHGWTEE